MHESTRVAVEWWARFVSGTFGSKQHVRPGEDDGVTSMLATVALAPKTAYAAPEQVEVFKRHLASTIERGIERAGYATLGTDYGPDYEIVEACRAAGITGLGGFPWKTQMSVSRKDVSVSEGYGARMKVIFGERPCRDCITVEPERVLDDGYPRTVYGPPTGKRVEWVDNPEWSFENREVPSSLTIVHDEPCPSCNGALVQRPEGVTE